MSNLIHRLVLSLREIAAEINGSCTNRPVKESFPGKRGARALLPSQLSALRLLNFTYRNILTLKYARGIKQFDVI